MPSAPARLLRRRILQAVVPCLLAIIMLGASDPEARFNSVGHKMVCACSCGQILLECNHVGCPDSARMITELRQQIATDLPDTGIFNWFVNKYGAVILAAPIRGGFDTVAWIAPIAVLPLRHPRHRHPRPPLDPPRRQHPRHRLRRNPHP